MAKKKEHLDIVNISKKIAEGVDIAEKKIIDNIELDINKFRGMSDDFTASSSISRTLGTIEEAIDTRIKQIRSDITNKILNKGDNRAIVEEIDRSGIERSESPMWKAMQAEYNKLLSQNKVIKHLTVQQGHLQKMQSYSDDMIQQLQETEAKIRAMKGVIDRNKGTGTTIAYGGEHFGPSIADETLTSGIERGVKKTVEKEEKEEKTAKSNNAINIVDSNTELTTEAYVELARSRERLLAQRMKVAKEIKAAKEHGDLSENAEYEAAKAKAAELDSSLEQIGKVLNTARIASKDSAIGKTYTYKQGGKTYKVALGSSAEKSVIADEGIEVASLNSDLGQVLKNASIGKRMFRGEEIEITDISPTPMKEIGEIKENIQRKLQERMSEKVPITIDDIFSKITQRSATETLLNEAIKKKDKGKQALYTEQKGNQDKEINEMLTGYYEQIGETFTSDTQKHLNKEFSTILKNEKIPKNVKRQAVENLLDEVIKEKDIKSKQANFTSEGIGVERKFRSSFIAPNDNTVAIPSGETVKIFHPNLENIKDVAIGEKTYKTANGLTLSTLSQVYEDIEHTIQNIQGKYVGQEIPEFEKENISHFENQKKDIVSAIGESYNYALKHAPDLAEIIQNQVYRTNGEEFENLRSLYYDDDKNYANQDSLRKELRKKEIIEPRSDWTEIVDDTVSMEKTENSRNEHNREDRRKSIEIHENNMGNAYSMDEYEENLKIDSDSNLRRDGSIKTDQQEFVGTGHNISRLYSFKTAIDNIAKNYASKSGFNIDDVLKQMFKLNPMIEQQYNDSSIFRSKMGDKFSTKNGVIFNKIASTLYDMEKMENASDKVVDLAKYIRSVENGNTSGTRSQMEQIFVRQAGNNEFIEKYFEKNPRNDLFKDLNFEEVDSNNPLPSHLFQKPAKQDYFSKSTKERWIESYEGKEILAPYGILDSVTKKNGRYDITPINKAIENAEKMLGETIDEQKINKIKSDIENLQSWKKRIIDSFVNNHKRNLKIEDITKKDRKLYGKSHEKLKYISEDEVNEKILAPYSPAEKQKRIDKRIQNATEIMNKYKGTSLSGLRTFAKNYSARMGKANISDLIQKRYLSADDDLAKFEDMMIRSLQYYGDNPDRIKQEIKYRQKEYGESERIATHMVKNSQRQIEEAYDKYIRPIFQKNIEHNDINEKVDEKLIEDTKENKKKESSKKKKKSTKKSKKSTVTEEKNEPIIDNISENTIPQTPVGPTQTALGAEQQSLGDFGPAVQSHVNEIGKAIDIEERKIAVSERLVTQLGVEKAALRETLGLAGQTVRIGENAGFVTGINSQSDGDEVSQNINNGLIASMNHSGQFFKDYQAELLLQTAKDALTMKGKGSDIFTENVVMEKIGSNAFLDETDHKYYYTDSKGREVKLEDEISASQFYSAGRIGAKEWIDSPEIMSMKALVSELFSKGSVNVKYKDENGKKHEQVATNFDQLSELTGKDFGEIGYNEASQIIGNTVHKMLELTTKYGVSNISELTGNAKKEWDTFFENNNKKYEQIYGNRATGNKTLMNVASGKADDIKDLYNVVSQKMGIDLSNVNKLTETALVGQYVDYTTGARQNAAGTFDVMFGNILGDIKTTGGIRDSVVAQFQMLTDLIRVNSDEIASKMGIENTSQSIESFINSLRSVVFQVGKDGTAMAAQIEGMSEQQLASLLTGVKYNRMMSEQNPSIFVSEALGTIYGYKKQVEFSDDNKALYKRFEELRRDRATMGEFEALAQELGFTTKNISKKGNDRTYSWERVDEKTGKILHVGATFNENGGMLPHGNSISYRESDASEANTVKGQYIDLLRQELNLEQQIETLQVKRQAAIVNGNTQEAVDLETQIKNQEALLDLLRKQKKDTRFVEDNNENASMKKEVEDDYRESFEGKEIQYKGEAERQKIARKATNSLEKNYEEALKAEKEAELELKSFPKEVTQKQIDNAKKKAANIAKKYGADSDEYKQANLELSQLEDKRNNELFESDIAEKRERAKARLKQAKTERKHIEKEAIESETTEKGKKTRKKELEQIKKDFDKNQGSAMEQDAQFKKDIQNNSKLNELLSQRNALFKKLKTAQFEGKDSDAIRLQKELEAKMAEIEQFISKMGSKDKQAAANRYKDSVAKTNDNAVINELEAKNQDKIKAAEKQNAKNELLEQEKRKQQLLAQKSKMIEEQKKLLPISDAYQKKQGEIDEINSQIKGLQNYTWDADKRQIFQNGQLVATLSQEEAIKFQQRYNSELFKTQQMQDEVNKASQKKGFFGSIKDSVNSTLQYMLVWQAGYMIIGKVRQAIQTVINTTKELDKTMTNLQIVTGKTKEETYEMMKNYSSLAQELGGTIGEVSASANEWLRMGYNTAEVNTLITDTMMLSKLGMIDTTKATEYLTSAIKGYGVAVKDASEIVDMATALDMKYAVSSGYILEAMSKTAASAKLAKVEMSDLQSMIAIAGEVTQKDASVIGESFKTAFARYGNVKANAFVGNSDLIGLKDTYAYESNLSENSEDMSKVNDIEKVLNKVHIDLREKDMVTWRSYSDILKDIGEGWKTYSDYEKNAITTALFGTRQRENGLVVLENYSRVLQAQEVAVSSVGTAAKKYEAYQNSLEASTKKVSAAIEDLILKLQANGVLKSLSDSLVWLIKNLKIVAPLMLTAFAIGHLDSFILKLNKISYLINSKMLALGKLDIRGLFSGTASKISTGINSSRNYFEMEQLKGLETKKQLTTAQLMTIEFEKMYNILRGMSYEEAEQLALERKKTLEGEKQVASETTETAENYAQEQFEFMQTENDAAQTTSETSQTANDQIQAYLEGNSTTQEFLQLKGEEGQTVQDFLQLKGEQGQSLEDLKQLNSETLQSIQDKLQLSNEEMQTLLGMKFGKNQNLGNLVLNSQGKLTPLNSFMKASGYLMGAMGGWSAGTNIAEGNGVKSNAGKIGWGVAGTAAGIGLTAAGAKIGATIGTAISPALGTAIGAVAGGAIAMLGGKIAEIWNKGQQEMLQALKEELASLEEHYSKASSADTSTNIDRYDELAQGVNNLGENVSLTNDEYEEFINLGNELADTFPELVSHTDRFGNSLLGVGGKVGGLREQLSLLLIDLQKGIDSKLLDPKLAKEEFDNAKSNINNVNSLNNEMKDKDVLLMPEDNDIYYSTKYTKINKGNHYDYWTEENLEGNFISASNIENLIELANKHFSQGKDFEIIQNNNMKTLNFKNEEDIEKFKNLIVGERKKTELLEHELEKKKKEQQNQFTSEYLPAIMRESWDYSTLDKNLQEFTNRMAQGLDISKFDDFNDWKTFIEEKIVLPLKNNVEVIDNQGKTLKSVLSDLYTFNFEGSGNLLSKDIEHFDKNIQYLIDYYSQNPQLYNDIKEKMGIITNSDGTMTNSFGVTVTDQDIISDFLGVENQGKIIQSKLEETLGIDNDLVNKIIEKFHISEATALTELSSSKFKNITGNGSIEEQISNIEKYLKDNNIISLQVMVSSLTNSIEKDIKEGKTGASELRDFLENDAWNINPENFDINQFGDLSEETRKELETLIERAKYLGVTVGEAYNNVKELLSLNRYKETSLSVSNITSRYDELNKIAEEMRKNGNISAENADKIAESFPDLFSYIGNPEQFMYEIDKLMTNKSDLIKGSIKEDLSNNEKYFKNLAKQYEIDYTTYKTYAKLRDDIDKYGAFYDTNAGEFNEDQLKETLKEDFIAGGGTWNNSTEYEHYITQLGVEKQENETAQQAYMRWFAAFSQGIPLNFVLNQNIETQAEQISQRIAEQSVKDANKAYKDLQKKDKEYRKTIRDLNRQARDQRNKETLQQITDMLERRNLIIKEYDSKINAIDVGQSFLDINDYSGKYNSLNDKYDITVSKLFDLRNKFSELNAIIPKSSEEASKLASEMEGTASAIMDAEKSLFDMDKEMQSMGLEAFSKHLENINTQYEREMSLLDNISSLIENDNGIVDAWDLVNMDVFEETSKDSITSEREKQNKLLEEQIVLQRQANEMQLRYLDLLKSENAEDNTLFWKDHEQSLKDAAESLYESQLDFWENYGSLLKERGYDMQQFVSTEAQEWEKLGNLIDDVKRKAYDKKEEPKIWNVGADGKAPADANIGDFVKTASGKYEIIGKKEDGSFESKLVDANDKYIQNENNPFSIKPTFTTPTILKSIPLPEEILSPEWSEGPTTSGSLSNKVLTVTEKSINDANYQLKQDYKTNENLQITSPELLNDSWIGTVDGSLKGRIVSKIEEIYNSIANKNDTLGILSVPPKIDGEAWTTFGEEIAKYISDGINNAIEDQIKAENNQTETTTTYMARGAYGETVSSNPQSSLKKGQTVYFRTGSKEGHVGVYDGNGGVYHLAGPKGTGTVLHQTFDHLANKYEFLAAGWNGGMELSSEQADSVINLASTLDTFGRKNGQCQAWVADLIKNATNTPRMSYSDPESIVRDKKDWLTPLDSTPKIKFTNNTLFTSLLEHKFKDYVDSSSFELPENYTGSMMDNAKVIWSYLSQKGYSSKAIAAIIGNFVQESGLNPYAVNSIGATGLAQWLGGRKEALIERYGSTPDILQQLEFLIWELENTENKTNKKLKNADKYTISELTVLFRKLFERPAEWEANDRNRTEAANAYYNLLKDADLYATGTTSGGHQGGPAIVGEGKNSEIVDMPNKSPFVVSDATLFTDMPKGTHVIPIPEYANGTTSLGEVSENVLKEYISKYGSKENATTVLRLQGYTVSEDILKNIDKTLIEIKTDLIEEDIFALITKEGRDATTILEEDARLIEIAMKKIEDKGKSSGKTDEQIQKEKDDWKAAYEEAINNPSNPNYISYWMDKYTDKKNGVTELYKSRFYEAKDLTKPLEESLKANHEGLEEMRLKSEEQLYVNNLKIENAYSHAEVLQTAKDDLEKSIESLISSGADSEVIANAQEQYMNLTKEIAETSNEITGFKNSIAEDIKSVAEFSKTQAEYKNEFLSDAYNLGQTTDKAFAQQRKNIEAAIQDGLISLSNYENEFIANYLRANEGATRNDALTALQSDEMYISIKQSLNDWKEDTKNLFKEELEDAIKDFDRTLSKHEFTKPEKWDNKGQITSYYTEMLGKLNSKGNFENGWYDNEIQRIKDFLDTAQNLSEEEYKEYLDKIDEYEKAKLQSSIAYYQDMVSYQENIYSALQYRVNEYIDDLNLEKEAVSERYDEEIDKLTQVNEDKERSIKLSELQQKLDNAEKQKKRVYRAGVGFVYESDRAEVKSAKQELDAFWRQDKIDDLNTAKDIEIKFYDERIKGWERYLDGIEKQTKRFEAQQNHELLMRELGVDTLEELDNKLIQDRDSFLIDYDYRNTVYGEYNTKYTGLFDNFLNDYEFYLSKMDELQEKVLIPMVNDFKTYVDEQVQGYDTNRLVDDNLWKQFQNQFGIRDIQGLLNSSEELNKVLGKTFNGEKITREMLERFQTTKSTYYDNIVSKENVERLIKIIKGSIDNPYNLLDKADLLQVLNRKLSRENHTGDEIKEIIDSLDDSKLQSRISELLLNSKKQFEENVSANEISKSIEEQIVNSSYFQYLDTQTQETIRNLISGIATWDVSNDDIVSKLQEVSNSICRAINNSWQEEDDYKTSYLPSSSPSNKMGDDGQIYDPLGVGTIYDRDNDVASKRPAANPTNSSTPKRPAANPTSSSGGLTQTIGGVKFKCDSNGNITGFAKDGSDGTTTRSFLAGEEGTEIGVYPDGTVVLYGTHGPEIYENEPLGTTIFTAEESAKILGMYKNGTMNKGLNKYTGFSSMNSLDYYKYLNKNNSNMPEYFSTIPKYENTNKQKCGDTIYEIHTVELPNVENASTFWEELNNGVRRHIKDK